MPAVLPRVLHVCGRLTPMPCGVGDYTAHLADALARLDVPTAVLTSADVTAATDARYELLPGVDRWTVAMLPRIVAAVRRWKPDLVHMQFPSQGYGSSYGPWLLPAILSILGRSVVQTWHEYYPAGSGRRNIFNACTPGGLIAVRPNYLEQMPPWYRRIVSRKQFAMIPNAAALPAVVLTDESRRAIRERFAVGSRRMVAYFGFMYPAKGTEAVFDIASPEHDHLVLVGALNDTDPYHQRVLARMQSDAWRGHVDATGFLGEDEAASLLAAADAVVLPFPEGSGIWNTSVHSSSRQGTFVVTTSRERTGYDDARNVYSASPGDLEGMRRALRQYVGHRADTVSDSRESEWRNIAEAHLRMYRTVLGVDA